MSRPNVLQVGRFPTRFNERLQRDYQLTRLWEQPNNFLAEHGADIDIVVTSARYGCSAEQLAQMPNLRAICSFGVGYDSIAVDEAKARGIPISTTPDVLNECVADTAIGLLIDTARQFSASDQHVRQGKWLKGQYPLTRKVSGKKLGIVGFGRIGKDIAKRAAGFDMTIRYHNRRQDPATSYGYEADLKALARWADFLVLACPGGASTHHLIDAAVLEALGADGILVNIARGSVVDEQALVAALQAGTLGGAGLDVFEDEPRAPEALFEMPNVVLLPHVGSATEETRLAMENLVFDNLDAFIARGELLTPL
ncbi:hydroxyacid dehydrogenase [Pseudomonas daroniae]|uniref:Hydroxyacid dehydrogenase n=1 Tax=Phytopseudomonas daroniae TaxID=2487519 RepID=A0A4Q9QM78_9GAMM|nr:MULTISPECIES: 2-hydroxyacid dehydrogenase [Pseudomonas]TBU80701.1 hydroxyacid dehydrogenase [Pseudomonas daroniae]TBU81736.1 hydroxyacid dehydrogenase [Pseudomonas sp. FRB 228]TBU90725.1 hydroxyacid dehydrogenase [Pseudomonas daroniae]